MLSRPRLCSNIEEDEEEAKLPVNIGSFLPDKVGDQPMASRVPTRAMIDVEEPAIIMHHLVGRHDEVVEVGKIP